MTVWKPQDDGYADLTSHDSFVGGAPHNTFARMRRDDPLCWTPYAQGQGFWSVTRHADILALNKQSELFSSAHGIRIEVLKLSRTSSMASSITKIPMVAAEQSLMAILSG